MGHKRSTPQDFWNKVSIKGDDDCWLWNGQLSSRGYGKVHWHREYWSAHRLAYALTYGSITDGLFVCHTCDTPRCCNPNHLWLGTSADNNRDRSNKGRSQHGESHKSAKLTASDVTEIRTKYASGEYSQTTLAKLYGIAQTGIGYIIRRKNWKHVP